MSNVTPLNRYTVECFGSYGWRAYMATPRLEVARAWVLSFEAVGIPARIVDTRTGGLVS